VRLQVGSDSVPLLNVEFLLEALSFSYIAAVFLGFENH